MAIGKILAATAATAAGGIAYLQSTQPTSSSSSASSLPSRPVDPEAIRKRLSLYSAPEHPAVLVPEKSPLQDQVAAARLAAAEQLKGLSEATEQGKEQWLQWEKSAEGAVKSVVSPKDQLNPNAVYVAVATLAGSVLGRNRGFLLRLVLPPTFFLLSAAHFLPNTFDNAAERAGLADSIKASGLRQWQDKIAGAVSQGK
ncbi:hypothetical protein JCM10207_002624 [Rhodosporidiobolus poonsookiae]